MTIEPLLACAALSIGHGRKQLVPAIDLEIRPGELWAIIGRNGAGKTTWLRTMLGLLPPLSGRVIQRKALRLAYVPQRSTFDELYPVRARDVVRMGLERGRSFLRPRFGEPKIVEDSLHEVGIADLSERTFRSLSEGQKQRVLLARLVASGAEVAFLDEPTAAMDSVAEREALELLVKLKDAHQMAVVVVSHGVEAMGRLADRALWIDAGRAHVGSAGEVFEQRRQRDVG
jgi:zinc transport system ATP-binding protein